MRRRGLAALMCILLLIPGGRIGAESPEPAAEEPLDEVFLDEDDNEIPVEAAETAPAQTGLTAREDLINRIVALGEKLYIEADGKRKRAHYKSDIYVCKNFTVYLFRQSSDDFRMAEYPDTKLVIPNNLPEKQCKPYAYGFLWEDVPAEKGNPFEAAAQFIYDTELSKEENMALAMDFMRQAQRGDFFQMSADYEYGVGAHSAIMMRYDPETDEIHWLDSNMRGGKKNGIRYGLVQFDAVKSVEWWASAFCHRKRGATLYRLREDIIYAGE